MDILSAITYSSVNNFKIRIERIKYGWMDLCVSLNDKSFHYSVSNTCNPLNDLLSVAVSIVTNTKINSPFYDYTPQSIGPYYYVLHDLEPSSVVWLFKNENVEKTIIIWKSEPVNNDTLFMLAEQNFDSDSIEIKLLNEIPDLNQAIAFAMKGSIKPFIRAIVNVFDCFIEFGEVSSEDYNWNFNFDENELKILKKWLLEQ